MNILHRIYGYCLGTFKYKEMERFVEKNAWLGNHLPNYDVLDNNKESFMASHLLTAKEYSKYRIGNNFLDSAKYIDDEISFLENEFKSDNFLTGIDSFLISFNDILVKINFINSFVNLNEGELKIIKTLSSRLNQLHKDVCKYSSDLRYLIFNETNKLIEQGECCSESKIYSFICDVKSKLRLDDIDNKNENHWFQISFSQEFALSHDAINKNISLFDKVAWLNKFILPLTTDAERPFKRIELLIIKLILS